MLSDQPLVGHRRHLVQGHEASPLEWAAYQEIIHMPSIGRLLHKRQARAGWCSHLGRGTDYGIKHHAAASTRTDQQLVSAPEQLGYADFLHTMTPIRFHSRVVDKHMEFNVCLDCFTHAYRTHSLREDLRFPSTHEPAANIVIPEMKFPSIRRQSFYQYTPQLKYNS